MNIFLFCFAFSEEVKLFQTNNMHEIFNTLKESESRKNKTKKMKILFIFYHSLLSSPLAGHPFISLPPLFLLHLCFI